MKQLHLIRLYAVRSILFSLHSCMVFKLTIRLLCRSYFILIFRCPFFQVRFSCIVSKAFTLKQCRSFTGNSKFLIRFAHAAAAGCCKGNHFLSCKVILLQEGVDDGRRNIPPGMSANPTITGNLLIHTFHCRLKSHSWKRFWDYDTFVV